MSKFFLSLISLIISHSSFSQGNKAITISENQDKTDIPSPSNFTSSSSYMPLTQLTTDTANKRIEKMPEFLGGTVGLMQFIADNVEYPIKAIDLEIQGIVRVGFIVDETGKAIKPEILTSVHPLLDSAAIDVIMLLPNFIPAESEGKNVKVYYVVPIKFTIVRRVKRKKKKKDLNQ